MPTQPLQQYQYRPLEPSQIRILHIWSYSDSEVTCAIHHARPEELEYSAVSYAWSYDPNEDFCDLAVTNASEEVRDGSRAITWALGRNTSIRVKRSTWEMLKSLAPRGGVCEHECSCRGPTETAAVWVDQICINQADKAEKGQQVKMMHQIYQHANMTYVYLGKEEGRADVAFDVGYALAALVDVDSDDIPRSDDCRLFGAPEIDWAALLGVDDYKRRFGGFGRAYGGLPYRLFAELVLGCKWFTRTWTVQELVCSKDVIVKMGGFEMPWETLFAACVVAVREGLTVRLMIHSHAERVMVLHGLRQQYRYTKGPASHLEDRDKLLIALLHRTMPNVLPKFLGRGVTDARDKVFAALNMLIEPFADGKYFDLVDYTLSLRTVLIRAVELWHAGGHQSPFNVILPGQSVRLLSFLDWVLDVRTNDEAGIPSWVPHWDIMIGPNITQIWQGCQAGMGPHVEPHVVFAKSSELSLDEVPLVVRGIKLLKLHRVFSKMESSDEDRYSQHAEMLSEFSDPYPTTDISYLEAYPRVLRPEAYQFACQNDRTCTFWESLGHAPGTRPYIVGQARDTAYTKTEILRMLPPAYMLADRTFISGFTTGRAFISTTSGYMGLGPRASEPGDEIAVFFGGRSPYVIRRLAFGKYKFIGPCIILGIMGGEALDGHPAELVEDFVLV